MKLRKIVSVALLTTIGLMVSTVLSAQNRKSELSKKYEDTDDPKEKAIICFELEKEYRFVNQDSALLWIDQGMRISQSEKLDSLYLGSANVKSGLLGLMGRTEEGLKVINTAFAFSREKKLLSFEKTYAYRKGMLYTQTSHKDSAIYYLLINKDLSIGSSFMSTLTIGQVYSDIGDKKLAKKYLQEALDLVRDNQRAMDYLYVLSTVISRYEAWNDFEMVAKLREEYLTFKINRGDNIDKILEISEHAHVNLPTVDLDKQIEKLKNVFNASKRANNNLTTSQSVYKLNQLLNSTGKFQESSIFLEDGISAAKAFGNVGLLFNLEQIAYVTYKNLNDIDRALVHFELASELKDSLRKDAVVESSKLLAVKYETEKNEAEIALLKSEDEIKSLQLTQASQTRNWLIFGLLGALLAVSGLAYLYRLNQKRKQELEAKNNIIEAALEEKNILLREIHHRVKNNLQVISSILNLQSHYISDVVALKAINEGKNRVSSMALIHQNLYQDNNVTSISAKEYFSELIASLYESYDIGEGDIELKLEVDDMYIDVDTMVPLGLVVNELVSNALKHAFDQGQDDRSLTVMLRQMEDSIILKVKDNGRGTSLEEFTSSKSFGNKLIQAFKQKLKADLSILNEDGTEITFEFKNYKLAA